jgi:hypothetical protein
MSNFNLEAQIRTLMKTVQMNLGFEQVPDIITNTTPKTASRGSVYYCIKAMNGDAVIASATGIEGNITLTSLTIKDGDEFKCNLKTITLTSGNLIAYKTVSGYVEPPVPPATIPVNTAVPVISGAPIIGQILTSTTGTWTGTAPITYSYQWKRGVTNIGTNASTYTVVTADAGQVITCQVTATNIAGSASATSTSITVINTLLDAYPSASAAYSTRLLRAAYYGSPAIRVRRSSDNTEQNIGFTTSGNLDEAALTTFCGAGTGFVTTWYDQSGNSRNSIQTSGANQPIIYLSGFVVINNSKPALLFQASTIKSLEGVWSQTITTESNFGVFSVNNSTDSFGRVLSQSGNGNDYDAGAYIPMLRDGTSAAMCSFTSSGVLSSAAISYSTQTLFSSIHSGSQVANKVNNDSEVVAGDSLNLNVERTTIGGPTSTSIATGSLDGMVQEVVIYYTDQTSNRTGISTNINTYYAIY